MNTDSLGYPKMLDQGVRCGNHRYGPGKTYHESAAAVRECYRITREHEATMRAEQAAELAVERHLENRGYDAARAQEDYEQAHGVISFQDAWALADLENGPGYTGP